MKLSLKKIPPKKIYSFLFKYYRFILLGILVILICLKILIDYQYIFLTVRAELEPVGKRVLIDQEILEEVLNGLDQREENLFRARKTQYPDPFR